MLSHSAKWLAVLALTVGVQGAMADIISADARSALTEILPSGYKTAAVIPSTLGEHDKGRYLAVLVDTETEQPERVVRLLYLAWNGKWSVLDNVALDTKEYSVDGEHIVQTRNERLVARTGNRFLSESYKNLSLLAVILRGGNFSGPHSSGYAM